MAGSYIGLDIGSNLIKVAELKKAGDHVEVVALGVAPTPQEAYENSIIVDAQLLGQAVKNLLKQSGIRTNRCISSVSGQSAVVVRVIEVPQMNPGELAETMKWEVERHVPFAANEVVMDYQPIERPEGVAEGQNMEVLLAVAQQDMIDRHVEMLFAAGLKPSAIDVEPLAVGRTLLEMGQNQAYPPGYTVAIVNIGASNTDVGIFRDRLLAFPRTLPLAGDNLTRAIADYLHVDLASAETYKRDLGEVMLDQLSAPSFEDPNAFGRNDGFINFSDMTATAAPPTPASSALFDLGAAGGANIAPGMMPGHDSGRLPTQAASSPSGKMPFDFSTPGEAPPEFAPAPPPTATPFDLSGDAPGAIPVERPGQAPPPLNEEGFFQPNTGAPQFGAAAAPTPNLPVPAAYPTSDPAQEALRGQIWGAIAPVLAEMVQELRRSLDYYRGRAADANINEILLVGGTARLKNLAPFLERELGIPTRVADPLQNVQVSSRQHSQQHLEEIASLFSISIGLGVRDLIGGPPPKKKKQKRR